MATAREQPYLQFNFLVDLGDVNRKLRRARLVKHVSGPLHAKGTEVAMEELTLAYERLEIS